MIWLFDPLHRLPKPWRYWSYMYLTVYFARLTVWYWIENKYGHP